MSDNIEIITRFEHAFRAADQATIDELCDPGLVDHNPAPDHEPTLAGFKKKVAGFKASFPDIGDDGPSTSSPGVRYPSSTKNTRPSGFRQSATRDQKDSKRSGGTCESQKPKKTTS